MADYRIGEKTKHDVETMENELRLYQIKPNTLNRVECPNPIRLADLIRKLNPEIQFYYVQGVECSATVI